VDITNDDVRDIAELAKLELTDEEVTTFAGQLTAILQYFEHLQSADTSHVTAIASVLPLSNVLRPDDAQEPLATDEAIANAPDAQSNQFRVRAVLDE
jgi:aspartyl-tRNA(Asn)/glutamyl-tRNA(Gln) amidotransferase subunit C